MSIPASHHSELRPSRIRALLFVLLIACGLLGAPAGASAQSGVRKAIWGPALVGGVSQFPVYRDLGVSIYQEQVSWADVAPKRPRHPGDPSDPAYRWPAETDWAVAQAQTYGIRVGLEVIGAPPWANGGRPSNWAPKRPGDFATFITAVARHYPSVHMWSIWGEPSRRHNFEPEVAAKPFARLDAHQRVAPRLYARILDASYGALKHLASANVVIGGMTFTTGDISTTQWIENMRLPDGKPPRLDMYGHNPFSFRDPNLANPPSPNQNVDFSDLRRLSAVVDRNLGRPRGRHLPLFLSEWTIPTHRDAEFNFYVDPPVQSRWITEAMNVVRHFPRIYALSWINLYDHLPVSGGGLIQADGTKKPGYLAFKAG